MTGTYEHLDTLDHIFLRLEHRNSPMHVGVVALFERGPLLHEGSGVDIDEIRNRLAHALEHVPRYRQKLARVPIEGTPVWVPDPHFQLAYHIRHLALPHPGSEAQLAELAARVFEQPLDRERPLWELWVVEGLEGDRFALIHKVHHALADGAANVELLHAALSERPTSERPAPLVLPPAHPPRPLALLRAEWWRRATAPLRGLFRVGEAVRQVGDGVTSLGQGVAGLADAASALFDLPDEAPFNGRLGPHRRIAWWSSPLADLLEVAHGVDATLGDAVLAIVAGGLRRYVRDRGEDPSELRWRAAAPVRVAASGAKRGAPVHALTAWAADLPIAEPDALERIRAIREQTRGRHDEHHEVHLESLAEVASLAPPALLGLGLRGALRLHPVNLLVSNVRGPSRPLYLCRSRLQAVYPLLPLTEPLGLGLAALTCDGQVHWGVVADYDLVPDFDVLVRCLREADEEVRKADRSDAC